MCIYIQIYFLDWQVRSTYRREQIAAAEGKHQSWHQRREAGTGPSLNDRKKSQPETKHTIRGMLQLRRAVYPGTSFQHLSHRQEHRVSRQSKTSCVSARALRIPIATVTSPSVTAILSCFTNTDPSKMTTSVRTGMHPFQMNDVFLKDRININNYSHAKLVTQQYFQKAQIFALCDLSFQGPISN